MLTVEEAHEMTSIPEPHRFICYNTLETPYLYQENFVLNSNSCQGDPQAVNNLWRMWNCPLLQRSHQAEGLVGAACLNKGSSPELLLTSQARKGWDTVHSTEARCFSPFLLAREQAKELNTNQQWLLAPSLSNEHCAFCHFARHFVYGLS